MGCGIFWLAVLIEGVGDIWVAVLAEGVRGILGGIVS